MNYRSISGVFIVLLLAASSVCSAANLNWNTTNGTWTDNASWTPSQQPGGGDSVFFSLDGSSYISTLGANYTINSLSVNGSAPLTITGDVLTINSQSPISSAIDIGSNAGAVVIESALKIPLSSNTNNITVGRFENFEILYWMVPRNAVFQKSAVGKFTFSLAGGRNFMDFLV